MMTMDLETLRLFWWGLLGIILVSFVLNEGLTMGVCVLLPVLGTSPASQQTLIRNLAPSSLGSLAWFLVLMFVLFAAWPIAYAVTFSSVYTLLLLVVLSVLLRPLLLYFFQDFDSAPWQNYALKILAVSGILPALLLGLLAGNMLKGIPFHLDSDMRILFLGDFAGLFNPFAILVAACCLSLLSLHGAVFIQLQTHAELQAQAKALAVKAGMAFLLLFSVTGLWIMHLEGYHINSEIFPEAASNPLAKFVKRGEGLWLDNYEHLLSLWLIPILSFLGGSGAVIWAKWDKQYLAMLSSILCVVMAVLTFGVSMFPFLLPSNISLNSSLTIWDSSASKLTLQFLFWVAICALPMMLVVTRWVFYFFASDRSLKSVVERTL